jgi:hypothetical protein
MYHLLKEKLGIIDEPGTPEALVENPSTPTYTPPTPPPDLPSGPIKSDVKRKTSIRAQDGTPVIIPPIIRHEDIEDSLGEVTDTKKHDIKKMTTIQHEVRDCLGILGKK